MKDHQIVELKYLIKLKDELRDIRNQLTDDELYVIAKFKEGKTDDDITISKEQAMYMFVEYHILCREIYCSYLDSDSMPFLVDKQDPEVRRKEEETKYFDWLIDVVCIVS